MKRDKKDDIFLCFLCSFQKYSKKKCFFEKGVEMLVEKKKKKSKKKEEEFTRSFFFYEENSEKYV